MNGLQIFVGCFGLAALAVSIWAIWRVARSPFMRYKPLWIAGSLFGFIGFGINWSRPGDLFMIFGIQVPVVLAYKMLATGQVYVKTAFPLIAIAALAKSRSKQADEAR